MRPNDDQIDYLFKLVMLGESAVGKTNIIRRYVHNEFDTNISPTVGVDSALKTLHIDKKTVKLQIWDTAGQEKFRVISSAYYKNADGAILVYDISKKESFKRLVYWLKELKDNGPEGVKMILLGNKSDLSGEREVATEEAREFAEQKGFFFMEVSAKENSDGCVNTGFETLIRTIIDNMDAQDEINNRKGTMLRSTTYAIVEQKKAEGEVDKKKCCGVL